MSSTERRITIDPPTPNGETLTSKEFNLWLQGVEEMQPSNWVPDERQWRIIRAKLQQLIDTPVQERIVTIPHAPAPVVRPFFDDHRQIGPGGNRYPDQTWSTAAGDTTLPASNGQLQFAPTPPAPTLGPAGGSDFG